MPAADFVLEHHVLILDATMRRPFAMGKGPATAAILLKSLLARLGMQELSPLGMYPATDLRFPGFSFVQPITTSHIAGHYFEERDAPPHIHMDIYSCKRFDWRQAIHLVDQFFDLAEWDATYVVRHRGSERQGYQIAGSGAYATTVSLLVPQPMTVGKEVLLDAGSLERI